MSGRAKEKIMNVDYFDLCWEATMTVFDAEYRLCANSLGEILRRFDPLEVAAKYAHKYGLKIYPWVTLFDNYYPGLEGRFFAEHPQYLL